MGAGPVYAFAIQYGLGHFCFDISVANAEAARMGIEKIYAASDKSFEEFRLEVWDMVANWFENNGHLKGDMESEAVCHGVAWLALTSAMHNERPSWDGFCLKMSPRPGQVGVRLESSNPYAEHHEGREQLFAVGKAPRHLVEEDTRMFRAWAEDARAKLEVLVKSGRI